MKAFANVLVLMLLLSVTATAFADDGVVLLGLQSVEGDDDFANGLTDTLREEAARIEAWQLIDRAVTLAQMSLAHRCGGIGAACLSDIAAGLQVGRIIYGTVQRTSAREDYQYSVALSLFDAQSGAIAKTVTDVFPSYESQDGETAARARQLLLKLGGVVRQNGSILVRANVRSADVTVNGEPAGRTEDGSLLVEDIQPGIHRVEIQGPGFEPYSESVTVKAAEQSAVLAILRSLDGGEPVEAPLDDIEGDDDRASLAWLGWTLVGVAAAAVGGAVASWFWLDSIDTDDKLIEYRKAVGEDEPRVSDVCEEADAGDDHGMSDADFEDVQSMCSTADTLEVLQYVFVPVALVAGGAGTYVLISEMSSGRERAEHQTPALVLRPRIGERASSLSATVRFW